jgi:hypothetical protein
LPRVHAVCVCALLALLFLSVTVPNAHADPSANISNLQYPAHITLGTSKYSDGIPVTFQVNWSEKRKTDLVLIGVLDNQTQDFAEGTSDMTGCPSSLGGTVFEKEGQAYCALLLPTSPEGWTGASFHLKLPPTGTHTYFAKAMLADSHGKWRAGSVIASQKFSVEVTSSVTLTVSVPADVTVTLDGVPQRTGIVSVSVGSHTVSIPDLVSVDNVTRLRFDRWTDGYTSSNRLVTLEDDAQFEAAYVKQFMLTATSTYGNATGTGWYDEGTTVTLSVVTPQPMSGLYGLLGGKYVFSHWSGGSIANTPTASVKVDGPNTVTAVWSTDYGTPIIAFTAIIIFALMPLLYVFRKRKAAPTPPLQQPAPPSAETVTQPVPEQRWADNEAVVPVVQKPPAPLVGELDVWTPTLFLVGMFFLVWFSGFFLGSLSWFVGLLCLILATIYVHDNAKKYGVKSHTWDTLLIAPIGLPWHAYELHKLRRAQQTDQFRTSVEPAPPATTPSVAQQASTTSPPTKFCRKCGAKILRDSVFCEECGMRLSAESESPTESLAPSEQMVEKNVPYGKRDVLDFLIDRLHEKHAVLVTSSSDLDLSRNIPDLSDFCPEKYRQTVKQVFSTGFVVKLEGKTEAGRFSFRPVMTPFHWGRESWIAYTELEAKPEVLSLLGYDIAKACDKLEAIRNQIPSHESLGGPALAKIRDRIDTIKHLGEYPPEYQERIWFAELVAKNYSLGTRLGFFGAAVGFMVAVMTLILVSEQASRFVELQSLMWLLSFIGIGAGWFVGKEIGSYLEKDAAKKKGIIYRRNIHRLVPIPVPKLG